MSDRGIKKFNAFKSLRGQEEQLNELKKSKSKREPPELTEDQIEKVDHILMSLKEGERIKVTVFTPYEDLVYKNTEFVSLSSTTLIIKDREQTLRIKLSSILDLDIY